MDYLNYLIGKVKTVFTKEYSKHFIHDEESLKILLLSEIGFNNCEVNTSVSFNNVINGENFIKPNNEDIGELVKKGHTIEKVLKKQKNILHTDNTRHSKDRKKIDFLFLFGNEYIPVEIKYLLFGKTDRVDTHGYECLEDIYRLENILKIEYNRQEYLLSNKKLSIFITDDTNWITRTQGKQYNHPTIFDKEVSTGVISYSQPSVLTRFIYYPPFKLKNQYCHNWIRVQDEKSGKHHALITEVINA